MIKVDELLYDIDFKLNKLSGQVHQFIPIENKIIALNEAMIRLIKKKVNLNNLYRLGFDAFKSRYQDLQNLVVDYEAISTQKTKSPLDTYEFDITKLKNEYYLPVDLYLLASKGNCSGHIVYIPRIAKHGDVTTLLNNPHYKPSFLYQEAICSVTNDKVIIYVDDFEIEKVMFSYIRYPKKIGKAGVPYLDGTVPTVDTDCELPGYLRDELLELTIMELGFNTDNPNAAQAALTKSQNSE